MGSVVTKQQPTASASGGSDIARPNSTESLERESEEYADSNAAGSGKHFDIVCVPCNRDGATEEAFGYCCQCKEHLCGLCYKTHKKATPCRHHKLIDKNAMPSTQRLARRQRNLDQDQASTSTTSTPTIYQQESDNSEQSTSTANPTQPEERQYLVGEALTSNKQQQGQSETSTKATTHYQHQEQASTQTQPTNHPPESTSTEHNPISTTVYDNITYNGKICVETSSDLNNCIITGLTMISPDKLVMCDTDNKSIKLVNVNNTTITISQLSLTGRPWDITSTSSTQVAVTVINKQQIQFINVSDKLSLSHTIQTDGECYGICYHHNKMVITYNFPGKIEIISMDGKVITCVEKDSIGADVFIEPEYVQANSNNIYVSDSRKDEVIMLNWKGDVTSRIGGLGGTRGLALLHDGSLLVCEWWDCTVNHVSGDGTNKRTVLENVRRPKAICVDEEGHKLYISRKDSDADINNNILVYEI